MSFTGAQAKVCLILKIDLPGHTIRLSEGGEVDYDGGRYAPIDGTFGVVTDYQDFTSGEADIAPAFELTWGIKDIAAAVALSNPASQGALVDFRVLSIDRDTNAVLLSHPIFVGLVDSTELIGGERQYEMPMGFITEIDKLINTDKGNRLNRSFHRSIWAGEMGLDFMTGTTIPGAWGEESRRGFGGGGGGPGGGLTRVAFV